MKDSCNQGSFYSSNQSRTGSVLQCQVAMVVCFTAILAAPKGSVNCLVNPRWVH